jgi:NDP-sugar pyrophosphorylase family protein
VAEHVHEGYWIDIGTPEKYLQVHRDILQDRFHVERSGRPHAGGWVHEQADVHPEARLEGPFHIGPGCHVEKEARIGPGAVLVSHVRVDQGAEVLDSVLWAGCSIGAQAHVEGALLADGVQAGRRSCISPGSVLGRGSVLTDFSRTA